MQQVRLHPDLPQACPECETELDFASGICPACFWDPSRVAMAAQPRDERPRSYSERYGSRVPAAAMTSEEAAVSRGRLFLIVGAVATLALVALLSQSINFI